MDRKPTVVGEVVSPVFMNFPINIYGFKCHADNDIATNDVLIHTLDFLNTYTHTHALTHMKPLDSSALCLLYEEELIETKHTPTLPAGDVRSAHHIGLESAT